MDDKVVAKVEEEQEEVMGEIKDSNLFEANFKK